MDDAVTLRMAVAVPFAERVALEGVIDGVSPAGGLEARRFRVPAKLSLLLTVMVDLIELPCRKVMVRDLGERK